MKELIIIAILLPSLLYFVFLWGIETNWKCFFGKHQYVYWGEKHGMVMDTRTNCLIGTNRRVYCCTTCRKEKPREEKDYD